MCSSLLVASCGGEGGTGVPVTPVIAGQWLYSATLRSDLDHGPCVILPTTLTFVQNDTDVVGTFTTVRLACVHPSGLTDTSVANVGHQVGALRGDSLRLTSDHVLLWHRGVVHSGAIDGAILQVVPVPISGGFTAMVDSTGHFQAVQQ